MLVPFCCSSLFSGILLMPAPITTIKITNIYIYIYNDHKKQISRATNFTNNNFAENNFARFQPLL